MIACGGRPHNELPQRFGETLVLIAVGNGACPRLYLVAGIAHGDGKAALVDTICANMIFRCLDKVATTTTLVGPRMRHVPLVSAIGLPWFSIVRAKASDASSPGTLRERHEAKHGNQPPIDG
jgi:hypothetical protein